MNRCLQCYEPLQEVRDFHAGCARKFFSSDADPRLPFSMHDVDEMAKKHVLDSVTVPGVQKKLSLNLHTERDNRRRLTIVGYQGEYILKPPTKRYPELPELEDVTMHMADLCGIHVVPHTLIRLQSGEAAYLTSRVDRLPRGGKRHMEDLCQLSERLTEYKYSGSVEQVGKLIYRYSVTPGLDRSNYFELLLFCFLTGNADMHRKNFAMLRHEEGYRIAPAYDLLPTALVLPADREESALTVDGKKRSLDGLSYLHAADTLGIPSASARKSLDTILNAVPACEAFLEKSFLSAKMREEYLQLVASRANRLRNS